MRVLLKTLAVLLLFVNAQSWAGFSDGTLNEWLGDTAVPALTKTLTQHPRFKGETIRIAVLDGETVAGQANGLSTATRDAVHSALLEINGADVVKVDGPENCATRARGGYFLAVAAQASGSRNGSVDLRIFDVVERKWVTGFGHRWRGKLTSSQRDAVRRMDTAASATGMRVAPFTASQSDLLAAKLATELACQLQRQGNDELTVQPTGGHSSALIAGNLAGKHGIPVASPGELLLTTRVHKVSERLYQIWAILTADDTDGEIGSVTSSAYATRPLLQAARQRVVQQPAAKAGPLPTLAEPALLSPVTVVAPTDAAACASAWEDSGVNLGERPVVVADACFALSFERHPEARLYIINHRSDSQLTRLHPSRCSNDDVSGRFPTGGRSLSWDQRTGTETYYIIAAHNKRAAGRLDRVLAGLPDNCGDDRQFLPEEGWLNDVDAALRALGDSVEWRAVHVYHQPAADTARLSNGAIR